MKSLQHFIIYSISLLLLAGCGQASQKSHDTTHKTGNPNPDENGFYGQAFDTKGAIAAYTLPDTLEQTNNLELIVTGKIIDVCQSAGCWLELDMMNGETIFVTFKNDSFVIPKDSKGRTVIIKGFVNTEIIEVEMLKRIATDEGQSAEAIAAIKSPRKEYSIVASGLLFDD